MDALLQRTAPLRDAVVTSISELLSSRDAEEVPLTDTYDRVDYRLSIVFAGYDISPDPEERDQHIRDLLTDLLHYCAHHDIDIDDAMMRAVWMRDEELGEWNEREQLERQAQHERTISGEW